MNPFVKIAIGFVSVVAVAVVLIFWLTAGEDHEIRTMYNNMLSDARRYDADAVTSGIAMNYSHNGYDRGALVKMIKANIQSGNYDSIEERDKPKITVQGEHLATLQVDLDIYRTEMGRKWPFPITLKMRFEKEGTFWHVTAIDYEEIRR